MKLMIAVVGCTLALVSAATQFSDAPTGFDNKTNGMVDDVTHQADQVKFEEVEEVREGLGPLYNAQSCRECHQTPVSDAPNFAYVKIRNRGSKAATSVVVNAFQNKPQGQLVYPDDWQPMEPSALPANDLPPGPTEMTVGPFTWTPSTSDSVILMAVSATGDASNLAKFSDGKSISDWRLVPHDNNIGMRKV